MHQSVTIAVNFSKWKTNSSITNTKDLPTTPGIFILLSIMECLDWSHKYIIKIIQNRFSFYDRWRGNNISLWKPLIKGNMKTFLEILFILYYIHCWIKEAISGTLIIFGFALLFHFVQLSFCWLVWLIFDLSVRCVTLSCNNYIALTNKVSAGKKYNGSIGIGTMLFIWNFNLNSIILWTEFKLWLILHYHTILHSFLSTKLLIITI